MGRTSSPEAVRQEGGHPTLGELTASAASGNEVTSLSAAPQAEDSAAEDELTAFANNVDWDIHVPNAKS